MSAMSKTAFQNAVAKNQMEKSSIKLKPFTGDPMPLEGEVNANAKEGEQAVLLPPVHFQRACAGS